MSTITMTACDGCGQMAYDGFNDMFPERGWMAVKTCGRYRQVCSVNCLAVVAALMGGRIVVEDDLQSAVKPPRPAAKKRPAKPRGSA